MHVTMISWLQALQTHAPLLLGGARHLGAQPQALRRKRRRLAVRPNRRARTPALRLLQLVYRLVYLRVPPHTREFNAGQVYLKTTPG